MLRPLLLPVALGFFLGFAVAFFTGFFMTIGGMASGGSVGFARFLFIASIISSTASLASVSKFCCVDCGDGKANICCGNGVDGVDGVAKLC